LTAIYEGNILYASNRDFQSFISSSCGKLKLYRVYVHTRADTAVLITYT